MSTLQKLLHSRATGWILVVVILISWEAYGRLTGSAILPALSTIWQTWSTDMQPSGNLRNALGQTLRVMLSGFAIATVLGIVVGFLMGRSKAIWALLDPLTEWMRLTPITALVPLLVFLVGIGEQTQVIIVTYAAFFPVLLNSYSGAKNVLKIQEDTARTFNLSWLQTLVSVIFPNAVPYVFVGLRLALGYSLLVTILTGMLAGTGGIGYYILQAQQNFNSGRLFSGILTTTILGYAIDYLFRICERRIFGKYFPNA